KNTIELTLFDALGNTLGTSSRYIETGAAHPGLPSIGILTSKPGKKRGMTLVSYLAYSNETLDPTIPFIFDAFGEIRWYLDYTSSAVLSKAYYDNGLERLKNTNFYFGDMKSETIYEVNMMGEIINSWPIPGYTFHHKVLEAPNGNFLVCASKKGLK